MSFASRVVLKSAWPSFLQGAGIDAADPQLPVRIAALQTLRMLELLADQTGLAPAVQRILADRLHTMLG